MNGRTVLLGNFDGVHVGHRALIERACAEASRRDNSVTVWTFDTISSPALTTFEDKVSLLHGCGVDEIITEPFERVKDMTPGMFVREVLVDRLEAQVCVCGYNYTFGHGGKGDPRLLTELCARYGVDAVTVERVTVDNEDVSSSAIRKKLTEGDIEGANKLLGRRYSLNDTVKKGAQKGRTVGMPTVNFYPDGLCIPKNGVYATVTRLPNGKWLPSVTNVGLRPTVNDGRGISVETHIIGYENDLYGESLTVQFLSLLRDERKFDSLDGVSAAVKLDIEKAKAIFEQRNG